jgi:acetyl esterase/lipase
VTVSYPALSNEGSRPAMILLHGGGWRFGSPRWTASTAKLMATHGIARNIAFHATG